jgi:hypothetical protein
MTDAATTRRREIATEHLLFRTIGYVEARHPGLLDELEGSLDHLGDPADDDTKDDPADDRRGAGTGRRLTARGARRSCPSLRVARTGGPGRRPAPSQRGTG